MPSTGHRLRLASTALALVAVLLAPEAAAGKATATDGKATASSARTKQAQSSRPPSPALQKARAELAAVKKATRRNVR